MFHWHFHGSYYQRKHFWRTVPHFPKPQQKRKAISTQDCAHEHSHDKPALAIRNSVISTQLHVLNTAVAAITKRAAILFEQHHAVDAFQGAHLPVQENT